MQNSPNESLENVIKTPIAIWKQEEEKKIEN